MFRCVHWSIVFVLGFTVQGCSSEPFAPSEITRPISKATFSRSAGDGKAASQWVSDNTREIVFNAISGESDSSDWLAIAELDAVLDRDRISIKALPGRGPAQDLTELLNSRNVDVAIVQVDAFDALDGSKQAIARERLRYLFRVPGNKVHILAAGDLRDVRQLDGRKVNIDGEGSSTHLTARLLFQQLGIAPEFTTDDHATALERLQAGDIQAAVLLSANPSDVVGRLQPGAKFHLVPIPSDKSISGYDPAHLLPVDYPQLVAPGTRVDTVAVARVLAVRQAPKRSSHHARLGRLAQAIHSRFSELQDARHSTRWHEVKLSAEAHGWTRFEPAQLLLDSSDGAGADEQVQFRKLAAAVGVCSQAAPACDAFYDDFFAWRKTRTPAQDPPGPAAAANFSGAPSDP